MSLEDSIKAVLKESTTQIDEATKKDFIAAANIVKSIKDPDVRQSVAEQHAAEFAKGNPRFNHSTFHAACGTKVPTNEEQTPGLGKSLVPTDSKISGAEKTSKIVKDYKTTPEQKLQDVTYGSTKDEKAEQETAKIKAAYHTAELGKLKAEAITALFSGEELSEEFKAKAAIIFEAAVEQVASLKVDELEEEHQLQLEQAITSVKSELEEQIDEYLDEAIKQWAADNTVAIETGLKVEMAESFMDSLKTVFEDHYIDVPESKFDIVAEQASVIENLKLEMAELKESTEIAVNKSIVLKCEAIIQGASSGMTSVDADKLYKLSENVEYSSEEEFKSKVDSLKESFFGKQFNKVVAKQTIKESTTEQSSHNMTDVERVMAVLKNPDGIKLIKSSN